MLGRKQVHNLDSRCQHHIDVAFAVAIDASLICDQPDALAFQFAKTVLFQNVQAGKRLSVAIDVAITPAPVSVSL